VDQEPDPEPETNEPGSSSADEVTADEPDRDDVKDAKATFAPEPAPADDPDQVWIAKIQSGLDRFEELDAVAIEAGHQALYAMWDTADAVRNFFKAWIASKRKKGDFWDKLVCSPKTGPPEMGVPR
jgi:hypothetical protein